MKNKMTKKNEPPNSRKKQFPLNALNFQELI